MEAPPIDDSGYAEEEYYYNYQGQRTMKKNSAVWTEYFYSGTVQLFTSNHLDDMLTENILTPGGSIVASQPFDAGVADGWNFYTNDVRNSTTAILDADGTPVKQYTYDEFGNKTESGSLLNEITFTGAVSDSNTGLYYMNARYYNSDTGRFLSQDSYKGSAYEPWTQNLYVYTGNNPVNMIDPTGHWPKWLDGLVADLENAINTFINSIFIAPQVSYLKSDKVSGIFTETEKEDLNNLYYDVDDEPATEEQANEYEIISTEFTKVTPVIVTDVSVTHPTGIPNVSLTEGVSTLWSPDPRIAGDYPHIGPGFGASTFPVNIQYGIGIADVDVDRPYTGSFIDLSANYFFGYDYCFWPNGARAAMVTINTSPGFSGRYDYYWDMSHGE